MENNLIISDNKTLDLIKERNNTILSITTPKQKIKKREDGLDYVEYSYMDKIWKEVSPLYEFRIVKSEVNLEILFVSFDVELKDRLTGNVELGTGSARIQISKTAKKRFLENPNARILPFDVVDLDKNRKSALTNAIKNAMSRFGVCADVYQKREEIPTEEQQNKYIELIKELTKIDIVLAEEYKQEWSELKVGYEEFINEIENAIKEKSQNKQELNKERNNYGI